MILYFAQYYSLSWFIFAIHGYLRIREFLLRLLLSRSYLPNCRYFQQRPHSHIFRALWRTWIQLACQLPKRLKSFRALAKLNALFPAQFFEILAELIAFLHTARTTFCAAASPRKSINLRDRGVYSSWPAGIVEWRKTRWQGGTGEGIRSLAVRARLASSRRKYQRVSHISRIN